MVDENIITPKREPQIEMNFSDTEEQKEEFEMKEITVKKVLNKSSNYSNRNGASVYCGDEWKNIVNEIC